MKTKNYKHVGRGSRQQTCHEQSSDNGNHTEKTQHGSASMPPNTEITYETRNKYNK
jgi:hypothetical protein